MELRTKSDMYMAYSIENILRNGVEDKDPRPKYSDGTPANTKFVTHRFRTYDLSKGEFPILTLRPIAWKSGIKEMLWIYQKKSNSLETLHDMGVKFWDEWDIGDGTIGGRYGHTINRYDLFKKRVLDDIQNNPYGRRHVCNLFQEQEFIDEPKGLAPCAYETIWTVRGEFLDMYLGQRSGDLMAASGPGGINETEYAALLIMVARHTGYNPGKFSHFIANEHLYLRHTSQAKELLRRYDAQDYMTTNLIDHDSENGVTPQLILNPDVKDFYNITIDDFTMINYNPTKPQIDRLELGI